MKIAYPAIIHEEEGAFWVEFPDLEGCFSDGNSVADAISNASDALGGYVCSLMDSDLPVPDASDIKEIVAEDGFTTMVISDPLLVAISSVTYAQNKKNTKSVKKTLSIPEWLNIEAEKRHINFSSVLQQALIARIE